MCVNVYLLWKKFRYEQYRFWWLKVDISKVILKVILYNYIQAEFTFGKHVQINSENNLT